MIISPVIESSPNRHIIRISNVQIYLGVVRLHIYKNWKNRSPNKHYMMASILTFEDYARKILLQKLARKSDKIPIRRKWPWEHSYCRVCRERQDCSCVADSLSRERCHTILLLSVRACTVAKSCYRYGELQLLATVMESCKWHMSPV